MESRSFPNLPGVDDETTAHALPWRERIAAALRRPIALALLGVVLLGVMGVIHLNQVATIESANAQLNTLSAQQATLERQEALLREQLGEVTSPAYIDSAARALGLVPGSGTPSITIQEPQP